MALTKKIEHLGFEKETKEYGEGNLVNTFSQIEGWADLI